MDIGLFFTVHDRPDYFARTLDAWAEVRGLDSLKRIHFRIEPTDRTNDQIELVLGFTERIGRLVSFEVNPTKAGVLANPYQGFDRMFRDGLDFTAIGEEDILPTTDVIEYLTWGAGIGRDRPEILGVVGHRGVQDPSLHGKAELLPVFSPWIWGTWRDRWKETLRPTWDLDYSSGVDGGPSGWDWNLNLRVIPSTGSTVISPLASKSDSIGVYGVHSNPDVHETVPGFSRIVPPQTYTLSEEK